MDLQKKKLNQMKFLCLDVTIKIDLVVCLQMVLDSMGLVLFEKLIKLINLIESIRFIKMICYSLEISGSLVLFEKLIKLIKMID